ncbi:MAG: YbjN domain-containing protein [Lachnospiraceae bacterium]|nr:YbjN domain-containing protein [Lachnospiraceae bacterium]
MAVEAAKAFQALMESRDFNLQFLDEDESVIRLGFNLDNTRTDVFVFFDEDNKSVHFEGRDFVKIPADKTDLIYKLCNDCNNTFRWIKFTWDEEDGYVAAKADAVIDLESCAEECYEIVVRMCGIIDEAYPMFMKALWA